MLTVTEPRCSSRPDTRAEYSIDLHLIVNRVELGAPGPLIEEDKARPDGRG